MTLHPCGSCPYRKDAPSGLWDEAEYEKLPPYDRETAEQPLTVFLCHQRTGELCAGWVGCHDMDESLGLRFAVETGTITAAEAEEALDYVCSIELWESGRAARDHGMAQIEEPGEKALRAAEKLRRRVGDQLD